MSESSLMVLDKLADIGTEYLGKNVKEIEENE